MWTKKGFSNGFDTLPDAAWIGLSALSFLTQGLGDLNIAGTHWTMVDSWDLAPVTRFGAEKNGPDFQTKKWISPVMGDIKWMKIA